MADSISFYWRINNKGGYSGQYRTEGFFIWQLIYQTAIEPARYWTYFFLVLHDSYNGFALS